MANKQHDAKIDMAKKMLRVEIEVEEIATMTGLPVSEIEELKKITPIREREDLTEDEYIKEIIQKSFNADQKKPK